MIEQTFTAPAWMASPTEGDWGTAKAAPRMTAEQVEEAAENPDVELDEASILADVDEITEEDED